jgi:hypothetical protein
MVKLRCRSFAETLLIPAFVFFFFMLYPPAWVARRDRKTAAAAGGCISDPSQRSRSYRWHRQPFAAQSSTTALWRAPSRKPAAHLARRDPGHRQHSRLQHFRKKSAP